MKISNCFTILMTSIFISLAFYSMLSAQKNVQVLKITTTADKSDDDTCIVIDTEVDIEAVEESMQGFAKSMKKIKADSLINALFISTGNDTMDFDFDFDFVFDMDIDSCFSVGSISKSYNYLLGEVIHNALEDVSELTEQIEIIHLTEDDLKNSEEYEEILQKLENGTYKGKTDSMIWVYCKGDTLLTDTVQNAQIHIIKSGKGNKKIFDDNTPGKKEGFLYVWADKDDGENILIKITGAEKKDIELLKKQDLNSDLKPKKLSFFPNPGTGQFTLKFDSESNKDITIAIFDMKGNEFFKKEITNFSGSLEEKINLDNKKEGVYLLQISQGNESMIRKIIIEK